jgi:hypothetical protein
LSIAYIEGEAQKGWIRTTTFVNESDSELASFKGNKVSIQNTALRPLFKKAGVLKIYTMSLPSDPKQAALVRVRRVHVATVTLER